MNYKILLLGAVGVSLAMLAACNNDNNNNPVVSAPQSTQSLDTAQVLALARETSETAAPIPVNGAAVSLNDTTQTGTPIAVNAM
jgi:outer membrane murein-binding lipoprotein Lpp